MKHDKSLIPLLLASLLTMLALEAMHQLTLPLSLSIFASLDHRYAVLVGWTVAVLAALIAGLPSFFLLRFKKVANASLIGPLGALEGFWLTSIIAALILPTGPIVWLLVSFVSLAISYVIIHQILNQSRSLLTSQLVKVFAILAITAAISVATPYIASMR